MHIFRLAVKLACWLEVVAAEVCNSIISSESS